MEGRIIGNPAVGTELVKSLGLDGSMIIEKLRSSPPKGYFPSDQVKDSTANHSFLRG